MGETRVNLQHLLEDIRDSYPFPQEEAVITELIANALDSRASEICFTADCDNARFAVVDNGRGMSARELEEYHDIAATTKTKGRGIGFAGVGAKLALLVSEAVITETVRNDIRSATRWRLESANHAPWERIRPPGLVCSSSGTAVSLLLHDPTSDLLREEFISRVIQTHFYPILDADFMDRILHIVYNRGVTFLVNGQRVEAPTFERAGQGKPFFVRLGRRDNPVGVGFLRKASDSLPEDSRGLAVSTYGKVIKRGWDWIGVVPRNPMRLSGIVEIPKLSEILTVNKADFLKDATSLQKYYRYRKAIQESIDPILRELGELAAPREHADRDLGPIQREIERVLEDILGDFPELSPLLGRQRRGEPVTGVIPDLRAPPIGSLVEGVDAMTGTQGGRGTGGGLQIAKGSLVGQRIEPGESQTEHGRIHEGHRRRPGIMIGFQNSPDREDPAWVMENTIWVNTGHPVYQKVIDSEAERYHVIFSVSWVLSAHLEGERSPQAFMNRFLTGWASHR